VGGKDKNAKQQPMHSHCVLLDLVYFLFYKIYRKIQNAKQSTVSDGAEVSLGILPLRF
jgi:hypothetical protein